MERFSAILPKLRGNCAFPKNFHTRQLGEITVFYSMYSLLSEYPVPVDTTKVYSNLCETSKTELFAKLVNGCILFSLKAPS